MKNKSGQQTMGLPFGVIFSIILIVVFIVIAFIAIKHFLDIGDCAGVGQFYEELQEKVNEAWASQNSDFEFEINLPGGIDKICFADLSGEITGSQEDYKAIEMYSVYDSNLFLIPPAEACNMPNKLIKHINVSEIISTSNPYCVEVGEELQIKKGFYDKLVIIE